MPGEESCHCTPKNVGYFHHFKPLKWHLKSDEIEKIDRQEGSKHPIDLSSISCFSFNAMTLAVNLHHFGGQSTWVCASKACELCAKSNALGLKLFWNWILKVTEKDITLCAVVVYESCSYLAYLHQKVGWFANTPNMKRCVVKKITPWEHLWGCPQSLHQWCRNCASRHSNNCRMPSYRWVHGPKD